MVELARLASKQVLTTLAHSIDADWVRASYEPTRKEGAVRAPRRAAIENRQLLFEWSDIYTDALWQRRPPCRLVNFAP